MPVFLVINLSVLSLFPANGGERKSGWEEGSGKDRERHSSDWFCRLSHRGGRVMVVEVRIEKMHVRIGCIILLCMNKIYILFL